MTRSSGVRPTSTSSCSRAGRSTATPRSSPTGPPCTAERELAMAKYLLAVQVDGTWVFVGGLRPSYATTVVRPAGGTTTMTDGPFAETKEQLGGFWVIECDDLDQALARAEKCALACGQPIEG